MPPRGPCNAFYGARVDEFLATPSQTVVGALTTQAALEFRGNEPSQATAWEVEVALLRTCLSSLPLLHSWGLVLEFSMRRLRRRLDAVLLGSKVIVALEFKVGDGGHGIGHDRQAEDYALCIRDFHALARGSIVVPIVVATGAAQGSVLPIRVTDSVAAVIRATGEDLGAHLASAVRLGTSGEPSTWDAFDGGAYEPTPNIVDAARSAYAGHSVAEIGRKDADGVAIQAAASRLQHWATIAKEREEHILCFVTGTPGAGKTLLGLDLVLAGDAGRVAGEPAVMLTGNRPLVHVLHMALADDAKLRGHGDEGGRSLSGALQTLLDYLKQHGAEDAAPPPEHVVVFDEAQRAWDAETGLKLLKRRRSEPELFLEILGRIPWACLVCLVGPGQEINRGEAGMPLWRAALESEGGHGKRWRVVAASSSTVDEGYPTELDSTLQLSGAMRSYRNVAYGAWVDALLSSDLERARSIAAEMAEPPMWITRDLDRLRAWLRERQRGGRRSGLLASSGAVRLTAEGVPPAPMSGELDEIAHWFLRVPPDFRGSDSLEKPLSEFGCQGLELDYVGLCWGGDLIWSSRNGIWTPRKMKAPNWQNINKPDRTRYRLNAYRVLLTRAREGVGIYLPRGDRDDPTRAPLELQDTESALIEAGCGWIE